MSSRARIGIVVGAIVIVVVAFVIANGSGGGDDDNNASSPSVVKVVNAKPDGGVAKLKFTKGDTIRFAVQSDTADEIHFHGYDVHKDVDKGGTVSFAVPATIEGRFIVELEDHKTQIAEVEVDPS